MPKFRAAFDVIGPIDATSIPANDAADAAAAKFCTVEELVNVMQSGG
jgi:hypothetical protein